MTLRASVRVLAVAAAAVATVLVATACAGPGIAPAAAPAVVTPVLTPIVGSVPYAPVPVVGDDGNTHLVYELSLINYTNAASTLTDVAVQDAETGATLLDLSGTDLGARLKPTGGSTYAPTLQAGQNGMLYLHVTMPGKAAVPDRLTHRLTATVAGAPTTETVATTTVTKRTLPVLGPPLKGAGYIAADGCCDAVRHTRATLPVNGAPLLAQRYAIDYEQIGADDRIYSGDKTNPASYRIFGQQALAVADATVVDTHDGLPEQVPGTYPTGIPITEADGNYVVLDIGGGFYVNYAHLQPGSLQVKPGDTVHKGDVLGLVGNTGNSVAPHLHLHVMDAPSPVVSEGLPYLVDSFTITGRTVSTAAFDDAEANGTPLQLVPGLQPTTHTDQMPLDQAILTY